KALHIGFSEQILEFETGDEIALAAAADVLVFHGTAKVRAPLSGCGLQVRRPDRDVLRRAAAQWLAEPDLVVIGGQALADYDRVLQAAHDGRGASIVAQRVHGD